MICVDANGSTAAGSPGHLPARQPQPLPAPPGTGWAPAGTGVRVVRWDGFWWRTPGTPWGREAIARAGCRGAHSRPRTAPEQHWQWWDPQHPPALQHPAPLLLWGREQCLPLALAQVSPKLFGVRRAAADVGLLWPRGAARPSPATAARAEANAALPHRLQGPTAA